MDLFEKILIALIIAGLAVYVLDFVLIQNTNFYDATTHIRTATNAMEGNELSEKTKTYPISIIVLVMALTILPFTLAIKIIPLILFIANTILSFKLAKKLFSKNWKIAMALISCNYWLIVFSTINYVEPFLVLYLQAFFLLFLFEYKSNKTNKSIFFTMAVLILLGAITKLTGVFFVPLLFLALFALFLKKKKVKVTNQMIFVALIVLIVGCAGIFLTDNPISLRTDSLIRFTLTPQFVREHRPLEYGINQYAFQFYRVPLEFFRFPPNDCLNKIIFGEWLPATKALFIALALVIVLVVFFGGLLALKDNLVWKTIVLTASLGMMPIVLDVMQTSSFILPRYTIPIMPLIGLLFAKGYENIKKTRIKVVVMVCLVVLCTYTLGYTGYLGIYYYNVNSNIGNGIQYIESLPSNSVVCGSHFTGAVITDYIKTKVVPCSQTSYATHVWVSCYTETISLKKMQELDTNGFVKQIWVDKCNTVFKVLDQNIFWKPQPKKLPEEIETISPIKGVQELWLPAIASTYTKEPDYSGKKIDACH